jgi:hypothetical protein
MSAGLALPRARANRAATCALASNNGGDSARVDPDTNGYNAVSLPAPRAYCGDSSNTKKKSSTSNTFRYTRLANCNAQAGNGARNRAGGHEVRSTARSGSGEWNDCGVTHKR